METICGSPMYVAPEVIRFEPGNDPYGSPCDMWSAGVILYILLCGVPPFDDESEAVLYNLIAKGDYSLDDPVWAIVSDDAKDFIAKLLCVDPSRRLTADQALAHPWMNKETTAAQSAALPIAQGKLKAYAARMAAPRMTIQPGSFLIKQGEKGSEVFFIKSGTCEVLVYNPAEGATRRSRRSSRWWPISRQKLHTRTSRSTSGKARESGGGASTTCPWAASAGACHR